MSKSHILDAIRAAHVPAAPLPTLDGLDATYADPAAQFAAALSAVAGECRPVADAVALSAAIEQRYPDARIVFSCLPDVPCRAFTAAADADPHAFESVELAVVPAEFGVVENGAVWISSAQVPHRACLFLAQHVAVVLPRQALVANMHTAYARLAQEPLPDFGVFIAGPSKTADIEQCLVIGAHGARSLTVFLIG